MLEGEKKVVEADKATDSELEDMLGSVAEPLPVNAPLTKSSDTHEINKILETKAEKTEEPEFKREYEELLKNFKGVSNTIVANYHKDRSITDKVTNELHEIFLENPKPPRHIVEGLVGAIRANADNNANIIKMLDAIAKMIAASKNVKMAGESGFDLSAILDEHKE